MNYGILSVIPPILVISITIALRSLVKGILVGIATSIFLISYYTSLSPITLLYHETHKVVTDKDSLLLYAFLILVSAFILSLRKILTHTNNLQKIKALITNRKKAEFVSIILSFITSIDDYLSILTVGGTISSIAEKKHVSRLKLAYLVHSLAGPLVVLIPISSWAAAIVAQIHLAGANDTRILSSFIAQNAMSIFLSTLPFIFYSIIVIASVFFVSTSRITFSFIGKDEKYDKTNDASINFFYTIPELIYAAAPLILPITLLVGLFTIGNLILGLPLFMVMCSSAGIVCTLSFIYGLYSNSIQASSLPVLIWQGFIMMYGAITILFLGSILSTLLHDYLNTGHYLTQLVSYGIPLSLLPLLFFVISLAITLTTGSAWNTFTLLIVLAISMAASFFTDNVAPHIFLNTLYPLLGAVLSGAVCGDHISPSSETTIMTASSVNISPDTHAISQLPYVAPAVLGSLISFTIVGFMAKYSYWLQWGISSTIGLVVCLAVLYILNNKEQTK